jgi:hypothetical protein
VIILAVLRIMKYIQISKAGNAWALLSTFYIISLIGLWPGVMSPDADAQYAAAIAGLYSDHHPPAMSFLWRYLNHIYPGPGLMFTFHISMLYGAAAIFIYIFRNSLFKWWYAIYPIIPNILAYTALIVKDTGFTYSYLLSGAILAVMMVNKTNKHKYLLLVTVITLLCYGTAVKFQAQYVLIFFTIGIGYCINNYKLSGATAFYGVVINIIIMILISNLNATLVPQTREAHSWQLVKLYDLSSISIELDKPLYPDFVLQQPNFDFKLVKKLYEPREVDPLVFPSNSVLKAGNDLQQREQLWSYWFQTIKQHPFLYLKTRLRLFSYNLTTSPSDRSDPVKFLSTTALKPILEQSAITNLLNISFSLVKIVLRFVWLLPLLFFYSYIAVTRLKNKTAAAPLLMFSATSIMLLLVLLFFSMAGTARYVFLCTCLIHASHGFAYFAWSKKNYTAPATRKIDCF